MKMNREELIKLSRENLRKSKQGSLCECYDEAFIKGYELSTMRITELEKENAKLREKLNDIKISRDYWKCSSYDWRHNCKSRKSLKDAVKTKKQLIIAKEIMQELCDIVCGRSGYDSKLLERVEHFISYVE